MAAVAADILANLIPAEILAPVNQVGQLNNQQVTNLRIFYLEKQRLVELPTCALVTNALLVVALAIVILGNVASLGVAFGIGLCSWVISLVLHPLLTKRLDQSNKNAADALTAPGFYDFAMRDPRQLANAEQINATFARFLAAPPPEGR
jgi:hypothetical protein